MMKETILDWCTLPTPIEPLTIVWGPQGLIQADFTDGLDLAKTFVARYELGLLNDHQSRGWVIEQALERYFMGDLKALAKIAVAPIGTPFSCRVWKELCRIPPGATRTYGRIAEILARPGAARAVGMACHNNPIGLVVPCHRVVGHSGKLTGYAGGLHIKEWLLNHEGVQINSEQTSQIRFFA